MIIQELLKALNAETDPTVVIDVEGGLVCDVRIKMGDEFYNIVADVRDRDVEGCSDADVDEDDRGEYIPTLFDAD